MAFAIDSLVRGCHIYKDVWIGGIDSGSPESAIVKTGMPLHMQAMIHQNSHGMLLILLRQLIFIERKLPEIYFWKGRLLWNIQK